jgi:uncharacterized protein YecA (UPF0149 family)
MKQYNWFLRLPLVAQIWQWLIARWLKRRMAAMNSQEAQMPIAPKKIRKMVRPDRLLWDSQTRGTYRRRYPKIGRNILCPCNNNVKFKRCCGK